MRKYGGRTIGLLIANGPAEAVLAGRLQARLPSRPPIVFIGLDTQQRPVPKSTGHTYRLAMKESLDLRCRASGYTPRVRRVWRIALDAWYENEFRSRVQSGTPGVEFTFMRGYSVPALTDRWRLCQSTDLVSPVHVNTR